MYLLVAPAWLSHRIDLNEIENVDTLVIYAGH